MSSFGGGFGGMHLADVVSKVWGGGGRAACVTVSVVVVVASNLQGPPLTP